MYYKTKTKKNPLLETDRLMAFSDGVFAIAITLLILEVKIPKHEELHQTGGLYNYLLKIWPSYLSYFTSFLAIGVYWSNHHWLFTFIKKSDHVFNMLNIFFLMCISFMPFTTAILGDYILDAEYKNAAATAYCVGYLLPIIPIFLVYQYAVYKHRLVEPSLNQKFINKLTYKLISGMVLIGAALCLSFQYPNTAISLIGVCMLIYLLPPDTPVYDSTDEDPSNHL